MEELFYLTDYLLVMTVNPGFAGQKHLDFVDVKIKKISRLERKNSALKWWRMGRFPGTDRRPERMGVRGLCWAPPACSAREEAMRRLFRNWGPFKITVGGKRK